MTDVALQTLLHPFERGLLDLPPRTAKILFMGARSGIGLTDLFAGADLTCVQGFRPAFLALERDGWRAVPEIVGEGYDAALVLAGRHRAQNEAWVADALARTRKGGLIVVAGGKTDGIASLRKWVERAVPLQGHASKHHGLVFWMLNDGRAQRYTGDISEEVQASTPSADQMPGSPGETGAVGRRYIEGGKFETAPGMFSHEYVDPGSRLLAECLPSGLTGSAADFCAGWGYLAVELAARSSGIVGIDLYEADFASLDAARRNLGSLSSKVEARFFWHDLVGEPVGVRYDVIVMNPPFHTGRAAEPDLGEALIRAAARALKPGGQLFMVANRQLPYEATLSKAFSKSAKLREERGFKVFHAWR